MEDRGPTRRRWLGRVGGGLALALVGPVPPASAHAAADADFDPLFDGASLAGWTAIGGKPGTWRVADGTLGAPDPGKSWLSTNRPYADFDLRLSFRIARGGNSGVLLRAPHEGDPSFEGLEIQILDDAHPGYAKLRPDQATGSVYGVVAARRGAGRPAGAWNRLGIRLDGPRIAVDLNGVRVVDARLDRSSPADGRRHPGLTRAGGFVGLQAHETPVWFRDLAIRELGPPRR